MAPEQIQSKILSHLKSDDYRPTKPRVLARELNLHADEEYRRVVEKNRKRAGDL